MNGLSSKNKPKDETKLYLYAGGYVCLLIILLVVIALIPKVFNSMENQRTQKLVTEVTQIVQLSNDSERTAKLKKVAKNENLEVVVLSKSGYLFQTLPSSDFEELDKMVNKELLSYYSSFSISVGKDHYQIWLAIYQSTSQTFFEYVIVLITGVVLVLFTLNISIVFKMFQDTVKPLRRLHDNIKKMRDFDLDGVSTVSVSTRYDGLLSELSEFTGDLQGKMDNLGIRYTLLEKELQMKRERMIYKDQLVGSVIHDLKTPLTMISMQLEELENRYQHDEQLVAAFKNMQNKNKKTLAEIQSAVALIHRKEIQEKKVIINLNKLIQETLRRFKPLLQKKQIYTVIDFPETVEIEMDEIEAKQLFHNIISNVAQYTKPEGMFELTIEVDESNVKIFVYNESDRVEKIDFAHVFDLFYHTESEENQYSTGIGMYTVRSMVEKRGGSCYFEPQSQGVMLTIIFPKRGTVT